MSADDSRGWRDWYRTHARNKAYINVTCPRCKKTVSSGQLYLMGANLGCPNCDEILSPMEWLGFREGDQ